MAWDRIHRTLGANGQVTMTPGYHSETIDLGDNRDVYTSYIDFPVKSDITMLVVFGTDLIADTYVQVEHSVNGTTWIGQGEFEEDAGVDHDDITKNMAKISAIDDSLVNSGDGMMMMYNIDKSGMAPYTRFTVKANGEDESGNTAVFYVIPHF